MHLSFVQLFKTSTLTHKVVSMLRAKTTATPQNLTDHSLDWKDEWSYTGICPAFFSFMSEEPRKYSRMSEILISTWFSRRKQQSSCSHTLHWKQEPHRILGTSWFISMPCEISLVKFLCLVKIPVPSGHKLLNLENKNDEAVKDTRKYYLISFSFKVLFAQISIICHFSRSIWGRKLKSGMWAERKIYFHKA